MVLGAADGLPASAAEDVRAALRPYLAGEARDFVRLFPVPLWSFLHWALPDGAPRAHAERAHALALLLHLWDDHLVDGQLPLTFARLHLRGAVWNAFTASARALCAGLGAPEDRVREHGDTYLDAVTAAGDPAGGLAGHCALFERQAAVWTLVPRVLEETGSAPGGLVAVVRNVAVAWRLTDDVSDLPDDAADRVRSGVWYALGERSRELWTRGRADAVPEQELRAAAARLRDRAAVLLREAEDAAGRAELSGLRQEVSLARQGLTPG
ncbi:hypothetical protein [Streptomyces cacaoi]|uniref:hypothetical protein n=1 Tax=Streptomyces cacaoi TaxID=1898 RepID=UPI00261622F4|nr:hypothetical protein [Streptomyces cacaoi]